MGASCTWSCKGRQVDGRCKAWSGGRVLGLTCGVFEAVGLGSRAEEESMSIGCDEEARVRGSALVRVLVCRADEPDAS